MTTRWDYLRQFLRSPATIGAVTPSSRALARAVAHQIDLERARVVIEYGPGTGVFTRELLRRLSPEATLVAIELHPGFCAQLRQSISDPRFRLVQGSATDVEEHLNRLGIGEVDAVVSALPFANLPRDVSQAILARSRARMAPGARFVAVQYLPFALLPLLRRHFRRAWIATWCPWNLPPALVLVGTDGAAEPEPSGWREARWPLAGALAATAALGAFRRSWGMAAALSLPLILALYRDPSRRVPAHLEPGAVLAPAEGTVIAAGPGRDSQGNQCQEIRIFLALWDVHVQRAPMSGVVQFVRLERGQFRAAFTPEAGDRNQRVTIRIEGEGSCCEVVQVAGLVARRIACWVQEGQRLEAGQRLGMIKLGSQVVLRLPVSARIVVQPGERVRLSEDIVAWVNP